MNDTGRPFAVRLTAAREERGWSMRELGRRAGVIPSTVHRAEHGHDITLASAAVIARALGISLDALLKPVDCPQCTDRPPAGFQCTACGAVSPGA